MIKFKIVDSVSVIRHIYITKHLVLTNNVLKSRLHCIILMNWNFQATEKTPKRPKTKPKRPKIKQTQNNGLFDLLPDFFPFPQLPKLPEDLFPQFSDIFPFFSDQNQNFNGKNVTQSENGFFTNIMPKISFPDMSSYFGYFQDLVSTNNYKRMKNISTKNRVRNVKNRRKNKKKSGKRQRNRKIRCV